MSNPVAMSVGEMRALLQQMRDTAERAGAMGDLKLQFQIQCKIAEFGIRFVPKNANKPQVAKQGRGRPRREPEPDEQPSSVPEESAEELAALSDEELERSLGR